MSTQLTDAQKSTLKATLEQAASGKASTLGVKKLPMPDVEPVNPFGVLEPDVNDAVNNTYIVISPPPAANDGVSFYWNGDYSIPTIVSDGFDPLKVKVPPALVIAAANKTISVIYSVVDPDSPGGTPSETLTLTVGKYTVPVYPAPLITEANGGELDVTTLTANAKVTVKAWPGIAIGQKIWLDMTSTPDISLTKWQGFAITTTGEQVTDISLAKLKTLTNGSTATLELDVSFDGGLTKTRFPISTYIIKQEKIVTGITIDKVFGADNVDIPSGGSTAYTEVTIQGSVTMA